MIQEKRILKYAKGEKVAELTTDESGKQSLIICL